MQPRTWRSFAALRMTNGRDLLASRRGVVLVSFGILILFLIPRLALLFVRDPFFDELFTQWIAARSFAGILQALHHDSGPPLYYFIIHALGDPPLLVVRAISLLFATMGCIALLAARRFTAATLLAVFPPAVLFAVDARAYALCAMFVTFGVLALDGDRPYWAAIAFVAAAYSHYYGALFIPMPLTLALSPHAGRGNSREIPSPREAGRGWRGAPGEGTLATALAIALFLPGIWLALHQPRGSMAWIGAFPNYPQALFALPPLWLTIIDIVLLLLAAVRLNRFAAMTLIPLAVALALRIYFPLRFESVIAAPVVLWLAASARRLLIPPLIAVGLAICAMGIIDHLQRPIDDYRAAALDLRRSAGPGDVIVATGYLYLEAVSAVGNRVLAFPPEQAQHPGWRATASSGRGLPAGAFLWIGERAAPELSIIRGTRRIEPLYSNDRALVARVR